MPARMRAYAALAHEKYGLPVYPVLVNILPPSKNIIVQDNFEQEFMGVQARQDYRVINLWEVDAGVIFAQNLDPLLPFVPVLKGGDSPEVVQRALIQLQQNQDLVELESLLGFFASFVLESDVVRQIMRWDMTVLRESPWYQEILREGELRGLEQERALILRQLQKKIGALPEDLQAQVQGLNVKHFEALGEALLDFTRIEDLQDWLAAC